MESNASNASPVEQEGGALPANCVRVRRPLSLEDVPSLLRVMQDSFGLEMNVVNEDDTASESPLQKLVLLALSYEGSDGPLVGLTDDEYHGKEPFLGGIMNSMRKSMEKIFRRRYYGSWGFETVVYEEGVEDLDILDQETEKMNANLAIIDKLCVVAMEKIRERFLKTNPEDLVFWRKLYTVLKLIKVGIMTLRSFPKEDILKECDMGYLYGEAICEDIIQDIAKELDNLIAEDKAKAAEMRGAISEIKMEAEEEEEEENEEEELFPAPLQNVTDDQHKVIVVNKPTRLELKSFMGGSTACVMHGIVDHWNAVKIWSVEYLQKTLGHRCVPVMTADQCSLDGWKEEVMTLSEFVRKYIKKCGGKDGKIGYVTNYDIFSHFPKLCEDVDMLGYLCEYPVNNVETKGWFCPADTLTPLHFSSKHHILVQIFGTRYVRLFPPSESDILRSYPGASQTDSHIDMPVEGVDLFEKVPEMRNVMHYDLELLPGESLYIPKNWWSYARTLCSSFSASFLYNHSEFDY